MAGQWGQGTQLPGVLGSEVPRSTLREQKRVHGLAGLLIISPGHTKLAGAGLATCVLINI